MHCLILDTCVCVDLAVFEHSLVSKLSGLLADGKANIIVPVLVKEEWNGCKQKIKAQILKNVVDARKSAIRIVDFLNEVESNELQAQLEQIDPTILSNKISDQRIAEIEKLLNATTTLSILISETTKKLAVEHALEKKHPFAHATAWRTL